MSSQDDFELEELELEQQQDERYASVEERFADKYEHEYRQYMIAKELRDELIREKLSKKSMKDLIEEQKERKLIEDMKTDSIGSLCLVMNKAFSKFEPIEVLDDNQAITVIGGQRKEITILHEPTLVYMNMRKYWIGRGPIWKLKYMLVLFVLKLTGMMHLGILKFNLYFVRADGEYTVDPTRDYTPWELQRKLEAFLQLQGKLLKANIKEKMISGASEQENLMNMMKWAFLLIGIIVVAFLFVLNGGNL